MEKFSKSPTMEEWFVIWMDELKEAGYIIDYKTGKDIEAFPLTEDIRLSYTIEKVLFKGRGREKIKRAHKEKLILRGSTYRPDAYIVWDDSAKNIFFTDINFTQGIAEKRTPFTGHFNKKHETFVSWVDVKSPFRGQNCSDATFSLNRKVVYEKYKILVDKAILMPNRKLAEGKVGDFLFPRTFTPQRYFDKTGTSLKEHGLALLL